MKNKNIFVTGGAGIIGQSLVRLLKQENTKILVADLKKKPQDFGEGVSYREGDLNNMSVEEFKEFNPDIVFHLAAVYERSEESEKHFDSNYHNNVNLTHKIFSLCKDSVKPLRVINCSSYLVYDKAQYEFPIEEETAATSLLKETAQIRPRNLTGMAKLMSEMELGFINNFSGIISGLSARIYRGYGYNSRDIISRWIRSFIRKEEPVLYNEDGSFDFIFCDETAEGLLKLANSNYEGIVNLGTGNSHKIKHVYDYIANAFSYKKNIISKNIGQIEKSGADLTLLRTVIDYNNGDNIWSNIDKLISHERQMFSER